MIIVNLKIEATKSLFLSQSWSNGTVDYCHGYEYDFPFPTHERRGKRLGLRF